MRRAIVWLVLAGGAALLASWPLLHIVRSDSSGCGHRGPCDPRLVLPFGEEAVVLIVAGVLALVIAATLVVVLLIRGVIRVDVRELEARREQQTPRGVRETDH
jgi:hypothetical protein